MNHKLTEARIAIESKYNNYDLSPITMIASGDLLWNNVARRISQLFVIQEKSVKGIHLCQSLIPLSVPNPLDNLL